MASGNAKSDLRGLNVDKLAKGFADEDNIFKRFVNNSSTDAREIRWYKKTSGFLSTPTTTGMTTNLIANVASKARPYVAEQTWERQTSYVRKYFVESPLISMEDVKDTDVDIIATNIRDLTRAVARQVDQRIIDVITESYTPVNINTAAATGTGWDDGTNGNPVLDCQVAKQKIRSNGYDPSGAILAINSIEEKNLINWIINTKGSSIPQFSSEKVRSGVVMEFMGLNVVVSESVTTDYALVFVPQRAASWKSFVGITATTIDDPGIGTKIRVWEEGEALLTDPKAVHLITDTVT